MREIKFRVWVKEDNKWMYFGKRNGKLCFPLTVSSPDVLELDDRCDEYENTVFCLRDTDDLMWCQYTGLKDKNNIEIYERYIIHHDTDNENYEVMFVDGMFCWKSNSQYDSLSELTPLSYKVVGNIYENEELLNV